MQNNPAGAGIPPPPPSSPPSAAVITFDVYAPAWTLLTQQLGNWMVLMLVFVVIMGALEFVGMRLLVIGPIIVTLVGVVLQAGLASAAIKHVRGGTVEVNDLFAGVSNLGNVLAGGIIMAIAVAVGLVLCIIPGLIVGGLLMFTYLLIMDKGAGGVDALGMSWNTLKPQLVMAAVFYLVTSLIAAAGVVALGVGVLVTAPLAMLSIALTYKNFVG
jgi:uncharacterized membrane protein